MLDLPDDVLIRAKMHAARHRTTLKELVTEGLRRVIDPDAEAVEAAQKARSSRLIAALRTLDLPGPITPLTREEIHDRQALR